MEPETHRRIPLRLFTIREFLSCKFNANIKVVIHNVISGGASRYFRENVYFFVRIILCYITLVNLVIKTA